MPTASEMLSPPEHALLLVKLPRRRSFRARMEVRFVFGVTAASRNTRYQAAAKPYLGRTSPADRASFAGAPYSITSSARASRLGHIEANQPGGLHVDTNSNLVDCKTGSRRAWRPRGFNRCRRRPDDACPEDSRVSHQPTGFDTLARGKAEEVHSSPQTSQIGRAGW